MSQLLVDKNAFSKSYARLANVHPISEYSVTVDRKVLNDRTHARYIDKKKIRENVRFNLKKGIDTFIDRCDDDTLKNEGALHPLCAWACAQEGDDLKQIFSGAKFAAGLGTIKLIATTIWAHHTRYQKSWNIIAVKTNGVILLREKKNKFGGSTLGHYVGYKFRHYLTNDKPYGRVDTDAPVDNRPIFKMMVRSDIIYGDQSIGICCAAEIDALDGDTPIKMKTRPMDNPLPEYQKLDVVLHSELANMPELVLGLKTNMVTVQEVQLYNVEDIKATLNRDDDKCLAFLFSVLRFAENILVSNDACEITNGRSEFNPSDGVVKFTPIPKTEAMDLLTPEFKKKFNLGD